jgi:hypothetical protein
MRGKRCASWIAVAAAGLTGSCTSTPTTPATGSATSVAGGTIRQFLLPVGNPTHLDLGSARHLLFAVSASDSTSPSFQFRVQSLTPREDAFGASTNSLLREPGAIARPRRRTQAGGKQTESFWVNIGDSSLAGDRLRTATLHLTTQHAYFYLDQDTGGATVTDDQIARLANLFESQEYPTVTGTFGADPATDLEGDSHVYVVLSPAVDNFGQDKGLMGYFWSRDMLSATTVATSPRLHSNQKKAVFLTTRLFQQPNYTTYGTLAHEFTHLCVFNQKVLLPGRTVSEDTWLDEGWAMLSMDLCGFGLRGGNDAIAKDIKAFQDKPAAYSLTDWFHNPNGFSYGLSFLFTRYLYDRFGAGIIHDIMAYPDTGVDAVAGALAARGLSFQSVFADWAIANAISGLHVTSDSRFQYAPDIDLHGTYGAITLAGVTLTPVTAFPKSLPGVLRPWGTAYFDLAASSDRDWSFDFNNPIALFGSAAIAP